MKDKNSRLKPGGERRTTKRFPIEQEAFYKILDNRTPEEGAGRTVNISSDGILFETGQSLRSGRRIELAVNWPAQLPGGCALKLVAFGRLVRTEAGRAAMCIEQYEFRTRRTKDLTAETAPSNRAALPYY